MTQPFHDYSLEAFWEDSEYASSSYVGQAITAQMIADCEKQLGYILPKSLIHLLENQNGGVPNNTNFPTLERTSWAEDHVAITGIFGCDSSKTYSLCGSLGGEFMKEEWEYPDIGVYICDCPSAGHDMIALDYRACGKQGEPSVVHVDQENDYQITPLAPDFESFVRGLVHDDIFDTSEDDLEQSLEMISNGHFSSVLQELLDHHPEYDFAGVIRETCKALSKEKGYFALHADELSYLIYDIQFYLMSSNQRLRKDIEYLEKYPSMMVFSDGEFNTGGYAPDFIKDWLSTRMANKQILKKGMRKRLCFSEQYIQQLLKHDLMKRHLR
jgi:hypothetical protein